MKNLQNYKLFYKNCKSHKHTLVLSDFGLSSNGPWWPTEGAHPPCLIVSLLPFGFSEMLFQRARMFGSLGVLVTALHYFHSTILREIKKHYAIF